MITFLFLHSLSVLMQLYALSLPWKLWPQVLPCQLTVNRGQQRKMLTSRVRVRMDSRSLPAVVISLCRRGVATWAKVIIRFLFLVSRRSLFESMWTWSAICGISAMWIFAGSFFLLLIDHSTIAFGVENCDLQSLLWARGAPSRLFFRNWRYSGKLKL